MQNMIFKRKLPIPKEIKEQYPLTAELAQVKARRDKEIADVFTGKSGKMVLIIGPCSADREDAVLEYCERLAKLQEAVSDKLVLIPRVYTNKPRTTGDGYKGLLHQPDPRKTSDMLEGVIAIRRLHTNVLANTGLPTADEMLYPDNYRYLSDLLSYVAVGARSVENQEHRLTSSGIDIPCGHEKSHQRGYFRHAQFHHGRPAPPHLHLPGLGGGHHRQSPCPRHPPGLREQAR